MAYNRIQSSDNDNDNISDDSTMIDFHNTIYRNTNRQNDIRQNITRNTDINSTTNFIDNDDILDDDTIPLIENTNVGNNTTHARIARPLLTSASMRNTITKKVYWNTFINNLFAVIPYILVIYGYRETAASSGVDIYNLNYNYLYYYFFTLMIFYTTYIGSSLIIVILTFCLNTNTNTTLFVILFNNMVFQTSIILRIIVIAILAVRMIDNTPMNTITIPASNKLVNVDVFIPKHIQFMIIETILYGSLNYQLGETSGIIKMIITY
jgi:hypothetical protein